MLYSIRKHLINSGVQNNVLHYEWDNWDLEKAYLPLDKEFEKKMMGIGKRAVIAFTIGCLEWIVFRLDGLFTEEDPKQYLEASWAAIVDGRYLWPLELDYDYWSTPILGPLALGTAIAIEATVKTYEEEVESRMEPATEAAEIEKLVRHVLNQTDAFESWKEAVVQRLEHLYPRNPDDVLGPLVPPDVVNVDQEFSKKGVEERIDTYLRSLDVKSNPYLVDPEDMYSENFKGVPYTLIKDNGDSSEADTK